MLAAISLVHKIMYTWSYYFSSLQYFLVEISVETKFQILLGMPLHNRNCYKICKYYKTPKHTTVLVMYILFFTALYFEVGVSS